MNENNIFDDMNEIERIQADIARDLEMADVVALSAAPVMPAAPALPTASMPVAAPMVVPPFTMPVTNTPVAMPRFAPRPMVQVPQKRGAWLRKLLLVCVICTLGTASFGFAFGAAGEWMRNRGTEDATPPVQRDDIAYSGGATSYRFEPSQDLDGVATISDMVNLIMPSVVSLTTFTDPNEAGELPAPARRNGSGVIFAEDDDRIYIVTNHDVVRNGTRVQVRFSCGAVTFASPFAQDQDINISVITVSRSALNDAGVTNIVLATFGDSSAMRMANPVIALGNARGEGISASQGVVSTEEHTVTVWGGHILGYIDIYTLQTDASINYGDSGGPLLNMRGEVIGIIDASITIFDTGAQAEGIGHAIASNTVQPALYALVNRARPAIGIHGGDVPHALADALGIPPMGALIDRVTENGAAQRAGLQRGDIITGFNDLPVLDFNQMRMEVATLNPGDTVEIRILRDGEVLVLEITLLPMQFDRF